MGRREGEEGDRVEGEDREWRMRKKAGKGWGRTKETGGGRKMGGKCRETGGSRRLRKGGGNEGVGRRPDLLDG